MTQKISEFFIKGYAQFLKVFGSTITTIDRDGCTWYDKNTIIGRIEMGCLPSMNQAFACFYSKKILLDCLEDGFIIIVDLEQNSWKKIDREGYEHIILSPLYHWDDTAAFFVTTKRRILAINIETSEIQIIPSSKLAQQAPTLHQFLKTMRNKVPLYDMPGPYQAIYCPDEQHLAYFNFITQEKLIVPTPVVIDHSVVYKYGWFIFTQELMITAFNAYTGKIDQIIAEPKRHFMMVEMMPDNILIILSGDIRGNPDTRISLYQLLP